MFSNTTVADTIPFLDFARCVSRSHRTRSKHFLHRLPAIGCSMRVEHATIFTVSNEVFCASCMVILLRNWFLYSEYNNLTWPSVLIASPVVDQISRITLHSLPCPRQRRHCRHIYHFEILPSLHPPSCSHTHHKHLAGKDSSPYNGIRTASPVCNMTHPHCAARKLLLRGYKPNVQKIQITCGMCPSECIFCDIWQLASLVRCNTPLSQTRSSSPSGLRTPSPSSDIERSLKSLEAQFQTQRARLASILSICVVDGAEESEGLRLAYDRCLSTVASLLEQQLILERMLQLTVEQESPVSPISPIEERRSLRRENGSCGLRDSYFGRRSSQMGMAM